MKKYTTTIEIELESNQPFPSDFKLIDAHNKIVSGQYKGTYKVVSSKEKILSEKEVVIKEKSFI